MTHNTDYRTVPWVAVRPEHPENPDAGWTVWTRELPVNMRVAWVGALPDSEAIAHHLADSHNATLPPNDSSGAP